MKLAAPASYLPLKTLIEQHGVVTRDYRLLVVAAILSSLGLCAALALHRWGVARATSVNVAMIIVLTLAFGGRLAAALPGGTNSVLVLLLITCAVILRLGQRPLIDAMVTWLALVLWLWLAAALVTTLVESEPSVIGESKNAGIALDDVHGDVIFVFFDEYPNADFAQSTLGVDMVGLRRDLEREGFEVDGLLPVSYAFTEYAMPAFFMLDLPVGEGDTISDAERADLIGILGGRNPLTRAFEAEGYRTTVVESGWSGFRCMEIVDRCVVRSWYGEVTASVIDDSLLGGLIDAAWGNPFTHGTERVMGWLRDSLPSIVADDQDDLIIVHIMLPHTPMAFDAECALLDEVVDMTDSTLGSQARCANQVIRDIATTTRSARLTVVMGDHGTKLRGQTRFPATSWTERMIGERMRTLAAIRDRGDCSEPPARTSVNVGVRLMRCLGASAEYLPDVSLATSVHGEPLIDVYPP